MFREQYKSHTHTHIYIYIYIYIYRNVALEREIPHEAEPMQEVNSTKTRGGLTSGETCCKVAAFS
jgi:hypothetical protein